MTVRVEMLTGEALAEALPAVARLRIEVFRAWPYLYDGSEDYERRYLEALAAARGAVLVAAIDGDEVVGASTGLPMAEEMAAFRDPLTGHGLDVARIFYCAESVLRPAWRGQRLGNRFFDLRETHARSLGGLTHAVFCAVVRPDDHPLRPSAYRPLDGFWRKRGYAPVAGLTTTFAWKDVDQDAETPKTLQFWMRTLG